MFFFFFLHLIIGSTALIHTSIYLAGHTASETTLASLFENVYECLGKCVIIQVLQFGLKTSITSKSGKGQNLWRPLLSSKRVELSNNKVVTV